MQIIDRNSFDVRAAVYRYAHRDAALQFLLLPMIHIGSPAYYATVCGFLRTADAIIFEGVSTRSASGVFLAQRLLTWRNHEGLVHQSEGIKLKEFGDKLIHGDVTTERFDEGWGKLPFRLRVLLPLALPFMALYVAAVGTKNAIARQMDLGDLPSRDEIVDADEDSEAMDRVIVDDRDASLIDAIQRHYAEHRSETTTVAILYGARHMRAVTSFLTERLGYHVHSSEWLVVFEL